MVKRKVIRKSNRPLTYNANYYNWGGDFMKNLGNFNFKDTFSGTNVGNMLKGGLASGLGSAIGGAANNIISGGLESGAGGAVSNIGSTVGGLVGTVNPLLGGAVSAASGIIGGGINALFGSKLNKENKEEKDTVLKDDAEKVVEDAIKEKDDESAHEAAPDAKDGP